MLLREGPVSIVFVRYMNPISFQLGITWVYSSERPPPWPCPPCGLSLAPMLTWNVRWTAVIFPSLLAPTLNITMFCGLTCRNASS